MTHRERHTPDEAPARDATWTPSASASASASSSGTGQPPLDDGSLWTDWYHRASPVQQQEALLRSLQQGVLYAHQLAAPARTSAPHRSLLFGLLNGQVKELEPLNPPTLDYHDSQLDQKQREAAARAVATPDVCLIQGLPGTGKSRLSAEIILQAAQRGERILFVAPTAAALDRVLERLGRHPAVCPLRYLGAEESPAQLPAAIARLTLPERLRVYRETTLPAARAARDAALHMLDAHRREKPHWVGLETLADQHELLAERLRTLAARRAGVAQEVESLEPSVVFGTRWQASCRARTETAELLDGQLAGLQAELETITGKQAHLDNEWESIQPLAEARQGRRLWTGAWWRALLRSGLSEQVHDLEARREELHAARQRLEQDLAAKRSERLDLDNRYAAECRRLKDEAIARRRGELDGEIAALEREQDALREQWRATLTALPGDAVADEISRQSVAAGRSAWERRCEQDAQRVAAAEQWLHTVEEGLQALPQKLSRCANVIAITTPALVGERHPGDLPVFDLLILDESHQVTESEFAAAARRARRWVLLGEPQIGAETGAPTPRPSPQPFSPAGRGGHLSSLSPLGRGVGVRGVPRPSFFQRLWQNLHTDPLHLPFTWMRRNGQLLCRLRSLTAEQEKWIETEPVVDCPDIELRILSVPGQAPQVVEVLFPACMGIGEAKQFIFHELEELAVQSRGRSLFWLETAEEVILEFAPSDDAETETVALATGVREFVSRLPAGSGTATHDGMDWHTCSLAFARAASWTRQRAEEWIVERLGLRSTGRTVLLTVPHRLDPPLARFLSDLLFGGLYQPVPAARASLSRPPVEFVAVPAFPSGEGRQRVSGGGRNYSNEAAPVHGERGHAAVSVRAPRLRAVKGGAGLEVDLADDRPLTHMPNDLRALLPRQGLVNYLEALALVKHLEALLGDETVRLACEQWRQRRPGPCEHGCLSLSACDCPPPNNTPAVAVIALYAGQVELLRHLIQQSPALSRSAVALEVGPPSAFSHRECLFALVSLTRSHTHRAVSYGEHPHALAQALTRAASGLILFGDPGTLARRSQWHGPLDHLDESAAQLESNFIGQLVHYLQGLGPHSALFHVQEGSSK